MTIVESRIDAVKVYDSGATVYRVCELGGALPDEVEIRELPLALYDPTLRVRVEQIEPADATLAATDVRVGLHAVTAERAREEPAEVELEAVRRKIRTASAMLEQIEREGGCLRSMEVPPRPAGEEGKPPPASPMAARVLLEQLVDDALQQRLREAQALRRSLKELGEEERSLEGRIARASTARRVKPHELRKLAIARLAAGPRPATSARLVVEYFVPGARWAPAYQCRLSRDCRQAELQLRALVCQRSGEDWRSVRLILSTASPLTWTELPELTSIRIGRAQPQLPAVRGFRPPPRGAAALCADYDRERARTARLVPPAPSWAPPALVVEEPLADIPAMPALRCHVGAVAEAAAAFDEGGTPATGARVYAAMDAELACGAAPEEDSDMPAPPEPQAAPAPMARRVVASPPPPPMPPPMRPSLAAPMASAGPAPARARAKRRERHVDDDTVGGLVPEEAGLAAVALAFPLLRLPPAASPERCRLVAVDARAAYLEILARMRLEVEIDVLAVVQQAQRASAETASLALPEGACKVRNAAGHFDFAYEADARVDLESDGAFHSLVIGTRSAPCDVRYTVVPREDVSAFRVAKLRNPLAAPLLPGPVEVHVGGDYVLTSGLPTVARNGEFQLGLGVEQAIKVARNARFTERRSGAKVVATSELHHEIEIDVVNNLDREIVCEVRERIPQPSENAEVVVEECEVRPPWEPYTQRERSAELRGGRVWNVRVGAGASEKLHAEYVVKIYAQNELVGGNRREA